MHYLAYFHKVSRGKSVIISVKHCKETFLRVIHRKEVVIKKIKKFRNIPADVATLSHFIENLKNPSKL